MIEHLGIGVAAVLNNNAHLLIIPTRSKLKLNIHIYTH